MTRATSRQIIESTEVAAPEGGELPEDYKAIMAHPMWPEQVELERGMLREGADHVRGLVTSARERREMSKLRPVKGLLREWLPKVAECIVEWCRVHERDSRGGPKPVALQYVKKLDPYVAGLIALREILDSIDVERQRGVTAVAMAIGRTVEHEQQVRLWEQKARKSFNAEQKRLDEQGATDKHRRRVNIHQFNAMLAEGRLGDTAEWQTWPQDVVFRVGVALLDAVGFATGWFALVDDPTFIPKRNQRKGAKRVLQAKPELLEWLGAQLDHEELIHPQYMPTVVPPRRWQGTRDGAYWTPYVKVPRLIRFKASQEMQREGAADEYDAIDMPKVYDALHFLQEVPWRINAKVYETAMILWDNDRAIAKLPLKEDIPVPPRPADIETNPEALKKWKREAAQVLNANVRKRARVRASGRTFKIAQRMAHYERFYFPHMLDFRGRMYPIPSGLQPQGDDLARGLLEFAEGKPVTEENGGAGWIAVALASNWGHDKVSYDDRIAWVEEREEMWRSIAQAPLTDTRWAGPEVDKPFQVLACIFEWVAYLDHGFGYVSHLPVAVDGTCNGIQHLAAMTRDHVAAKYVNLVPSDKPEDIYKFVAGRENLQGTLERILAGGGHQADLARYWLELCEYDLPRDLTKRQVMVLPYGGTKDAFFKYTRQWLDKRDPLPANPTDEQRAERTERLTFLVLHMWDAVKDTLPGALAVMEWLRECAKHAAVANQPIFWVTPSGFVVRHFYGKQKDTKVVVRLDGRRVDLNLKETTAELSSKEQLQGIPPNFVHSLDAAALVLSILRAREAGVTAFSAIHDSYGTHAADMWALFGCLREAFVEVHSEPVLEGFRRACWLILRGVLEAGGMAEEDAMDEADLKLPALPEMGGLEIEQVLDSDYFFA